MTAERKVPGTDRGVSSAARSSGERIIVEGDVPKVAATRKHFAELRASLKNALDVTSDIEAGIGAGEGSRPSSPVAPDGPGNPCTDPLGDAITVLEHVRIEMPSARPDTEDAANRVNLALDYLRMVRRV